MVTHILAALAASIGMVALAQDRPASRPDGGASSAPSVRPAGGAETERIELRISRFIDLHQTVRHLAELPQEKRPAEFRAATEAAEEVNRALGGALAWGILEGSIYDASDVAAAKAMAERLPAEFQSMSGAKVPLRELAMRLITAYEPIEASFVERIWPEHDKSLHATCAKLQADLLPHAARCIEYIERSLGMENSQPSIPVYLVAAAPTPGAFTHRRRGGGGVCIVGVDERPGLMVETVLHECIHALDISTQSQPTALQTLRKELQAAGLPPRSEMMRSVPHTLMFVQAGETVRRLLNREHKHYGDVAGYYAKVPEAVAAVREPWTAFLEDKLSREEAIAKIVEKTPKGK